jgi:hypothetical protein
MKNTFFRITTSVIIAATIGSALLPISTHAVKDYAAKAAVYASLFTAEQLDSFKKAREYFDEPVYPITKRFPVRRFGARLGRYV